MVRSVLGVVVSAIVWMVGFFTLAQVPMFVWPSYAESARTYMSGGAYVFTAPMSVTNALLWFVAEVIAGWLVVVIARRREAAWVLAALLFAYLSVLHLVVFWDRFPWWYNLIVALPSGLAVLLGAKLASASVRPQASAAH
jgi:hypothetical protein